ncbi:hypothetical protein ACJ41O_004643 [Fusarium nematophilum]
MPGTGTGTRNGGRGRQTRDANGRFRTDDNNEESPFDGFIGNVQYQAGDKAKNAIGAAEIASVLFDVVQTLVGNPSDAQIRTANSVMATLGGSDGIIKLVNGIRQEQQEQETPNTPGFVGSTIRSINTRASSQGSYNTTPIPFTLTQKTTPTTGRKRPFDADSLFGPSKRQDMGKTQETAGRELCSTPFIVEDRLRMGNRAVPVWFLVAADETMIFFDEECANAFSRLLLLAREKTGSHISLSTAAKMAGLGKGYVLKMDFAVHLPDVSSASAMSYTTAILSEKIFCDADAAQQLVTDTVNDMAQVDWRISAVGQPDKMRATSTAEDWIPAIPVAKQLTIYGEPTIPLDTAHSRNGNVFEKPVVISSQRYRNFPWENYGKIPTEGQQGE